jgi:HAD superfamily hydrolase (TIGR01509 family)
MPLHTLTWMQMLGEYGYTLPEHIFYEMAGTPSARIVELLNERYGTKLPPEAADRKERLFEQQLDHCTPIEAVVQLARDMRGKLPMAVATGGTRYNCIKTLKTIGLLDHFPVIVSAEDVRHGKPAPDVFLEAARRLEIEPAGCVVLEDGEMGIRAARAAGMRVIDVRPYHPPQKTH